MFVTLDAGTILQVDATIITGILILLSIARIGELNQELKKFRRLRVDISLIVILFSLSAVLILITELTSEYSKESEHGSIFLMAMGFFGIMIAIWDLTKLRKLSNK